MAVVCDGQGQVEVMDLVEGINTNEADIAALDSDLVALDVRVGLNEITLTDHTTRIINLENDSVTVGDMATLEARVTVNEADIATNVAAIDLNGAGVSTNQGDIASLTARADTNDSDVILSDARLDSLEAADITLEGRISQNEADITALGGGGYAQYVHEEAAGVNGGSSTAVAWIPRNIATEKFNDLGAVSGPTSVTLDAGTYEFDGGAIVTGSGHQSRINIGGSSFIYSLSMPSEGESSFSGRAVIAAPTVVSVETMVTTAVANTGLGKTSSSSPVNIYVRLNIKKVG